MRKLLYCLFSLILLSACNSKYDKDLGVTVDVLYSQGLQSLATGNLKSAKKTFEKISDNQPFTQEAIEANVFLIWIYYLTDEITNLQLTADSFLKYYVDNKYTQWVIYMSAISRYEHIYQTNRDQTYTYDAFIAFQNIINKSNIDQKYKKDAEYRLQVIKYILAKKDNEVASDYLKQKNYISALKRYQNITNFYQNTDFTEEALFRQVYIWLFLGVTDEAFRVLSTLGYNYPSSDWYSMSLRLFEKYAPDYDMKNVIKTNRIHDQ